MFSTEICKIIITITTKQNLHKGAAVWAHGAGRVQYFSPLELSESRALGKASVVLRVPKDGDSGPFEPST